MCRCEGREHRTSWCSRCDSHPADGPQPPKPVNPFGLVVVLAFYALSLALVIAGVVRCLT